MKLSDYGLNAYLNNMKQNSPNNMESQNKNNNSLIDESVNVNIKSNTTNRIKEDVLAAGGLLKVPIKKSSDNQDEIYRRVAKFLLLIGTDEAAKVLPHLTQEQTEKIIPELASIRSIDKDEAKQILAEFQSLLERAREDGGIETARTILQKAFGSKKADEVLEKTVPFKGSKPFEYLYEANSEKITVLLKDEPSHVRALVLSYLKPKIAAEFIQNLPEQEKKEVVLRFAKMKEMNPEVLKNVDKAMKEKLDSLVMEKSDTIDGKSILAQILKRMDTSAEENLIDTLSKQNPDLGSELREKLFTTEDILNADDRFIQNKLQQMEDSEIAYLIAGKTDAFRNKMLNNVSINRKKLILDEENNRIPMRRSDVEKITSQFYSSMRRAWEEGRLIIKGQEDEIYV